MSVLIEMPKLSDTMTVGTVVKWYKKVGDTVENGDVLAEIETDKATMELENFDDGVLLKLLVSEGEEVEIGKPLAVVGEAGEDLSDLELTDGQTVALPPAPEESVEAQTPPNQSSQKETETDSLQDTSDEVVSKGRVLASPLAKKIALEKKIDLSNVKGSGPNGRIVKKDLVSIDKTAPSADSISKSTQPPRPSALTTQTVPVTKMRSVIAKRLLESKTTIPHFYLQREINSETLRLARESINETLSSTSTDLKKVSVNDMILLACAKAIPRVPEINSSWSEHEITYHGGVHLAFGVAVEDGLVTPVIRNAESLDLRSLSLVAQSLITKSRNKKLTPDEMSGSTFTVTNLGMFGVDFFSGIINPPNAAILSVGASIVKPVVDRSGTIRTGETMTLGLSCDHRLVDGAVGAQFLAAIAALLENPSSMLVL